MRIQGKQVETFRVIRADTQTRDTGGRASFLKREEKLTFKIKPKVTRQSTKTKSVRDHDNTFTIWQEKAEILLANCQCFLGEVIFSIQTQASAQLPHQMPDKTSSSTGTHPTTLKDKTHLPKITHAQ